MQFALVDGERSEPFPGGRGRCPICDSVMIAKCGPRVPHHWAHKGRRNCNPWWENETQWHRDWKSRFPEQCREIHHQAPDGEIHHADVKDSDGTLGGLQRQGEPIRLKRTIVSAKRAIAWCSSDPLCIDGIMSAHDGFSLASCHACVMAPETACEEFNRFLDRALVGLPGEESVVFFTPLVA